jgi:hypothetical protein
MLALMGIMFAIYLAVRSACILMDRIADSQASIRTTEGSIPNPFDAATMQPRLKAVRMDFVSALQSRTIDADYHDQLLHAARQSVAALPFFRNRVTAESSVSSVVQS